MSAPLFSVVTVTLNCAEAACRTAQSVLEQDFGDFEYLVKDGGSSDETVARLRQLGVRNIHVCKDGGIYPAMNQALARCSGRYVWYLNAGDTFASPTVLAEFAAHMRRHDFPAFMYGDVNCMLWHPFWQDPAERGPRRVQVRDRLSRFYLYRRTICHQVWAVQRALYEQCGGLDEHFKLVADYDFLLKAILRLRASYRRVPCVCVTYEAGGDAECNTQVSQSEREEILRRYFPPWERFCYEWGHRAARSVVHGRPFSRLYRHLPSQWQARLAGL